MTEERRGSEMKPFYMIAFTPRGGCRGFIKFCWPEGTAYCYMIDGQPIGAYADLEGRGWPLEQAVRLQCGIAARQVMTIGFAVDDEADVKRIADVVEKEFPDLVLHPRGITTWEE
jgi:hypothetical protein